MIISSLLYLFNIFYIKYFNLFIINQLYCYDCRLIAFCGVSQQDKTAGPDSRTRQPGGSRTNATGGKRNVPAYIYTLTIPTPKNLFTKYYSFILLDMSIHTLAYFHITLLRFTS